MNLAVTRRSMSGAIKDTARKIVIPEYVTRMGIRRPYLSHKKPPSIVPAKRPTKMTVTIAPANMAESFHRMIKLLAMTLSINNNEPSAVYTPPPKPNTINW
jgi:hypothetical protein